MHNDILDLEPQPPSKTSLKKRQRIITILLSLIIHCYVTSRVIVVDTLTGWNLYLIIGTSILSTLAFAGIGIIINFVYNLLKHKNLSFLKTLEFYAKGFMVGIYILIVIMILFIAVDILEIILID